MKAFVTVLAVLFLTGCCNKFSGYKDEWLDPCAVVPPPDRVEYSAANDEERKAMWLDVYVAQAKSNELCNSRIAKARGYLNEIKTGSDLK